MKKKLIVILCICFLLSGCFDQKGKNENNTGNQTGTSISIDKSIYYGYSLLDEDEQKIYSDLYQCLYYLNDRVELEVKTIDELSRMYKLILADHPELFYISYSYEYIERDSSIVFIPKYNYSSSQVDKIRKQIDEKVNIMNTELQNYSDQIDQMKYIYDYIIKSVVYEQNSKTDQNIISVFLEGKSVCAGYARAFQYMMHQNGLFAHLVTGDAKEDLVGGNGIVTHAWNMVKYNDDYYYIDPTWGDIEGDYEHTCDAYFMMTSDEMLEMYTPDNAYELTKKGEYSYFGDRLVLLETYDESQIVSAIKKSVLMGHHYTEVKCSSDELYNMMKTKLQSSSFGYELLVKANVWSDSARFVTRDALRVIELYY